ncbi:glycosyltransferase family 4 protein [Neisseria arctica]|uniref:glycosyltransferase family 4 protein n=1 Tax=Neisseria arctica TaxID=1470200 RepID=UPI0013792F81|nr:glycosyltransferase family 4 protein [Neisseria arctica]UOO86506.1 glycosyltransferase family 4 protein [Neisseria arctica]
MIIHACDGRSVHFVALLKWLFAKPMVITRHVVFPLKRFLSRWSYQQANAVVGVSKRASENLRLVSINATTIYGSVDKLAENEEILSQYSFALHRLKVGQVGNFQEVKNFPLTIELAKKCPETDFYLIGSGVLEEQLKKQATGLNNVFFIPFTPYIGSIFQHIDVQILPSHSEGLPSVILEGYQYAVPVLAHAVGGIPEIVEHGQTGFLIEQNQVENYQYYIQQLQPNLPLLSQLTQQTKQYWQQHDFSSVRMAKEYENIYNQILNKC